MQNSIKEMLSNYNVQDVYEKKSAIKEIIQEIILCGLARGGFFSKAAFYGGTALRIFYGLDRFSEDLDFSLMERDENFNLSQYFPFLENEAKAFGLNVIIKEKEKNKDSFIQSAFLKGNTREHLLLFFDDANTVANNEVIRIKFEVDTNPPKGANYEHKFRLLPSPYEVNMYDLPSLFAGKMHAVLCRSWQNRIKGRDLYDYVFYLTKGAKVNQSHLRERLIQTCSISPDEEFSLDMIKAKLYKRFNEIDYDLAKEDVIPFIKDRSSLDIWSAEFFKSITESMLN